MPFLRFLIGHYNSPLLIPVGANFPVVARKVATSTVKIKRHEGIFPKVLGNSLDIPMKAFLCQAINK